MVFFSQRVNGDASSWSHFKLLFVFGFSVGTMLWYLCSSLIFHFWIMKEEKKRRKEPTTTYEWMLQCTRDLRSIGRELLQIWTSNFVIMWALHWRISKFNWRSVLNLNVWFLTQLTTSNTTLLNSTWFLAHVTVVTTVKALGSWDYIITIGLAMSDLTQVKPYLVIHGSGWLFIFRLSLVDIFVLIDKWPGRIIPAIWHDNLTHPN